MNYFFFTPQILDTKIAVLTRGIEECCHISDTSVVFSTGPDCITCEGWMNVVLTRSSSLVSWGTGEGQPSFLSQGGQFIQGRNNNSRKPNHQCFSLTVCMRVCIYVCVCEKGSLDWSGGETSTWWMAEGSSYSADLRVLVVLTCYNSLKPEDVLVTWVTLVLLSNERGTFGGGYLLMNLMGKLTAGSA